jgi:hypothetical protein
VCASAGRNDQPTRGDVGGNVVPFRRRVWEPLTGLVVTDARPIHPLGSPRGKWAYATGEDGDGLPRGVYCRFREGRDINVAGEHWRLAKHAGAAANAPDTAFSTRGEINSGRWSNRLDVPLSGDPAVVRATARAILAEAERTGFPVGDSQ